MMPTDERAQVEALIGEMVNFYTRELMTNYPALAKNVQVEAIRHMANSLVLTMTSWCWAGRVPSNESTRTIEWPDGVWQMFKERHLPEWFKRIWPVRYHTEEITITTNHYFVCPHLVEDSRERHIQFMATGTKLAGKMRI